MDFHFINELCELSYSIAEKSGFHNNDENCKTIDLISKQIANMHGEASELWEAARKGELFEPCDKADRMIEPLTCIEEELADLYIRNCDFAKTFNVDLAKAVRVKTEFNKTRPYQHGDKLA